METDSSRSTGKPVTAMTDSADHVEVEWQFDVDDLSRVEDWLRDESSPEFIAVSAKAPVEQVDSYLDTDDWRVYRTGYALRLRRARGRAELTLKSLAASQAGLVQRREITQQLPDTDVELIDDISGPVGDRVASIRGAKPTRPLFTAINLRNPYQLRWGEREIGEIVLDHVTFIGESFENQRQLTRVELETTSDSISTLEPFVAAMKHACGLRPAAGSKFEIGLSLLGRLPSSEPELGPTTFDRRSSIAEMAYAVLRRHFVDLSRHEPGTRLGDDPEELHQMRVAARRLRAALALFSSYYTPEMTPMRVELGWLAGALGEVRDLDVQLEEIRGWQEQLDPQEASALEPLTLELDRRRSDVRRTMLAALDSERYERFSHQFTELLLTASPDTEPQAAIVVAPALVERRQRKFRRLADRLNDASPDADFHQARIEGKRLRYALEFVSPLYGNPAERLVRGMAEVQNVLGRHQDAIVAIDHLRELAESADGLPSSTIFVMGRLAERYATAAADARAQFSTAYARVSGKRLRRLERVMQRQARRRDARRSHGREAGPSLDLDIVGEDLF